MRLALVALFLLAVPASAEPKKVAVLIGVTKYAHPKLPDLKYTERDMTELRDVLKEAGFDVTLLASSGSVVPTADAVRSAVRAGLKKCTNKLDMVIVAMAGHGLQFDGDKTAYFCPADANPKDKATLVSLPGLIADLDESFAGVKLMLVDACRDDPSASHGADAEGIKPPKGTAALFACKAGEKSYESAKFGGGHGAFFHYVLEGLRGEAKNGRGEVNWSRLVAHVQENLPRAVRDVIGEGAARKARH